MALLPSFYWILALPTFVLSQCNYQNYINPGQSITITSPNYPNAYPRPNACYWTTSTNQEWSNYHLQLNCYDFDVYNSPNCEQDRLMVDVEGNYDWDKAYYYCGQGNFVVNSNGQKMNLYFGTSGLVNVNKRGFKCSITSIKDSCQCGWIRQNKIVGGEETIDNEFPWMVALVVLPIENVLSLRCGGSIITPQFVLTAAHCVKVFDNTRPGVLYGQRYLGQSSNVVEVERFIKHPNYNSQTQDYDIALVRTKTYIPFSQTVGPICLPFTVNNYDNQEAILMGWGTQYYTGAPSNTLLKTTVRVVPENQCKQELNNKMFVSERQICSFGRDKDSCQLDSGGPLVWRDPATSRHKLIGIISQGIDCASDYPSVNTRVSEFTSWIKTQTQSAFCID